MIPAPCPPARPARAPILSYGLALAMGVALVAWLIPLSRMLVPHPFHRAFGGDGAQSIIGQRYFLGEPWHWPVLIAHRLAWPAGSNVAFTDSLPLALLPLKLFVAWLPDGFYVQDSWLALAFALQPVAAVFALRSAGERRLPANLAIAVLSLCMPSLLVRVAAMSLCTHATILCALGLYFRLVAGPHRWLWAAAPVLLAACLLLHPYLLAMNEAVLAAIPLTLALRRDRRWRAAAGWILGSIAGIGGVAVLLGYGGAEPAEGFGRYSMNLLSPFVPGASSLFGDRLPDPTGVQWLEGDQYLGAGVLLLAAVALAQIVRRRARLAIGRHLGLAAVLGALALFALSNSVYAGTHLLLHFDGVPAAIQQFRATGRFFWPVAYGIVIAAITATMRGVSLRAACAILLLAAGLQVADTRQTWRALRTFERYDIPWTVDAAKLRPILARHRSLALWPAFGCGAIVGDDDLRFMHLLQLASETLMRTDTMYVARSHTPPNCDPAESLGAPWRPGELRIILPPAGPGERWRVPDAADTCRLDGELLLCAQHDPAIEAMPAPQLPVLPLGETIPNTAPAAQAMLGEGWFAANAHGTWSDGPQASLHFRLPPGSPARLVLTLQATAIGPAPDRPQVVRLLANGVILATWSITDFSTATLQATLPAASPMALTLQIESPTRPIDRGMNKDPRRLGLELRTLRLD